MLETLLDINDLHVKIEGKHVLKGVNLKIYKGKVHAIMGPNGSGKSTLSNVIMGNPKYEIIKGDIIYKGKSILDLSPDERARLGIYMAFQSPLEIEGIRYLTFLRTIYNKRMEFLGKRPLNIREFKEYVVGLMKELHLDESFLSRGLNENFSGGEKKKSEILQMFILQPELGIFDEIDTGLDVDSLKKVGKILNQLRDENRCIMLITHYPRLLHYVKPDYVHLMYDGRVVLTSDESIVEDIEDKGYKEVLKGCGEL